MADGRRMSQTLLAHSDRCPKSAQLYENHPGPTTAPLARGTAFHLAAERMLRDLIVRGEKTLYAPGHTQHPDTTRHPGEILPEDEAAARRQVASLTEAVVAEIRAEHPELHCTHDDWDKVRLMAFHWAVATPVDPGRVVAAERKFVMDLAGCTISGKIDVATLQGEHAEIVDYKTALALPGQEEFEAGFQHKFYATLLVFGQPVRWVPCPKCEGAGEITGNPDPRRVQGRQDPQEEITGKCGRCGGTGAVEKREAAIPGPVNWVRCREVYPRYLRDDGTMWERERTLTRTEITDFREDLEALVKATDRGLSTGELEAVPGHHCYSCPAPSHCPLPEGQRVARGVEEGVPFEVPTITDENEAEVATRWFVLDSEATALMKALRGFAKEHERGIRIGRDLILDFGETVSRPVDWDAYRAACEEADRAGRPRPSADAYKTERRSTPFTKRRLKPEEIKDERRAA